MITKKSKVEGTNAQLSQAITLQAKDAALNFLFLSAAFYHLLSTPLATLILPFCLFLLFPPFSAVPSQNKVRDLSPSTASFPEVQEGM